MPRSFAFFPDALLDVTRLVCASYVFVVAVAGCSDTETVTTTSNPVQAAETDDAAPAEPAYDPSLDFKGRYGVTENHSQERYRFDVAAYESDTERQQAEELDASHAAFLSRHGDKAIPSVQTIGTYVKQLDDRIYAGVERAMQDGLEPTIEPKRSILTTSLQYLSAHRSAGGDLAIARVAAALRLGGDTPSFPPELAGNVDAVQNAFLDRTELSKPFGFYTWSPELMRIWQQDRLLQEPLPASGACALADAISSDDAIKQRYIQLTQLYSRLTNPLRSSLVSMLDVAGDSSCQSLGSQAFLSRSETPEVTLFDALYPAGVPANADLMGDLITAIRAGQLDLTPKPTDGWYQHQLFALETLLVTDKAEERAKIAFMSRYKKRLREAFSTMLVQHRETHAKQSDVAGSVSDTTEPPVPHFRLEPLATVYVRHARSYVFLESALEQTLGAQALDSAVTVGASGPTGQTLRAAIRRARDLFFGLYVVASQDVGLKFSLSAATDPPKEQWGELGTAADTWLQNLKSDLDAASDVRVIVPIADLGNHRFKYWAVIGVRATLAGYSYIHGMDVAPPSPEQQARVWLPTEQFMEVESSSTPPTREEFRALCDQAKSVEAIKAALEAR